MSTTAAWMPLSLPNMVCRSFISSSFMGEPHGLGERWIELAASLATETEIAESGVV